MTRPSGSAAVTVQEASTAPRSQGAVIGNVRVRWGNMYVGYSYDYTLSEIESVTSGSHELVLALKLGSSNKKYRWLDRGPEGLESEV
jgi:hypothetical protein